MQDIKLTQYSHKAGCGCKIAPAQLEKILSQRSGNSFAHLLVGNDSNDDAAVWDLGNGTAMINTVDFFMPIVNDAFDFGRIASANAISDVYAMGGKPVFANAMLGWPLDYLPLELAARVLDGARSICAEAGIPLAGGHSIDSKEPLFGLSVSGVIDIANLKRNNTPQEGDLLILTKKLGTGIAGTAIKRGKANPQHALEAIESMCKLNNAGTELAKNKGVHALTDVTGFGLLGHLLEMLGGNFSAEIEWNKVPKFHFLNEYLSQSIMPDNTFNNWNSYENRIEGLSDLTAFQVLNDPQTSGGLLISVSQDALADVQGILKEHGNLSEVIGKVLSKGAKDIWVK